MSAGPFSNCVETGGILVELVTMQLQVLLHPRNVRIADVRLIQIPMLGSGLLLIFLGEDSNYLMTVLGQP